VEDRKRVYFKRGIEMKNSIIKQETQEALDAYCQNCDEYIVNQRVTFEECCDKCGTPVAWLE
jgi:hypothetical protein